MSFERALSRKTFPMKEVRVIYSGVIVPRICSSLRDTEAYYSATFSMSSQQQQQQQQPSNVTAWRAGVDERCRPHFWSPRWRPDARNYMCNSARHRFLVIYLRSVYGYIHRMCYPYYFRPDWYAEQWLSSSKWPIMYRVDLNSTYTLSRIASNSNTKCESRPPVTTWSICKTVQATSVLLLTTSSAIAKRPRCRVR